MEHKFSIVLIIFFLTITISSSQYYSNYSTFRYRYVNINDLPKEVDWVKEGQVTPVKQQLWCGACWAFAAVAAVEGISKTATGELKNLSEQQILDCSKELFGTTGCYGRGHRIKAFKYMIQYGVAESSNQYPYTGHDQQCDTVAADFPGGSISDYGWVPSTEDDLMKAVAYQVVSAGLYTNYEFDNFKGGYIFEDADDTCRYNPGRVTHAVAIVGYGTENGVDYWKIKNSWGVNWGDQGYMKIRRNVSNPQGVCGIARSAIYPTDEGV